MSERDRIVDRLSHLLVIYPGLGAQTVKETIEFIDTQMPEWVSVEDSLPPEWDTMFAKWKGTDKWKDGLFEKMSDDVRIVVELKDGTRKVHHSYTVDGKWNCETTNPDRKVLYWMPNPPLPEDNVT